MKTILSILICFFMLCSLAGHAQQFSSTTGVPCTGCQPINYIKKGSPAISTTTNLGDDVSRTWQNPGFSGLPIPPSTYSQGLPPNAGKNTFVSLKTSEGAFKDSLILDVSGFIVNKPYVFHYSVLSGSVAKTGGNATPFGELAKMEILTTGQNPHMLEWQTTTFNSNNQNKWITKTIIFTPTTSTLRFRLSGNTSGMNYGYINFDIDKFPFDCMLPSDEVKLTNSTITTVFPDDKINLYSTAVGPAPETGELVWKKLGDQYAMTPQQASNAPVSNLDPLNVKPYYAYYYAPDFNCTNVQVSTAELKFTYVPTQVPIKDSYIVLTCPEVTTDLTTLVDNPAGPVVWFTTSNHQGSPVQNPHAVPAGEYYAFYFDLYRGGFSLTGSAFSTAHVKVENAITPGTPDLGPTMNINSLIFNPNASKDFVVNIYNSSSDNSSCSVFFRILKLPGFDITYSTQAGQSNVDGGVFNNNDFWTFSEDNNFITVTAKSQMGANGYSVIGFKVTRKANTPANSAQNITVTIPQQGGGGEINSSNNSFVTSIIGI